MDEWSGLMGQLPAWTGRTGLIARGISEASGRTSLGNFWPDVGPSTLILQVAFRF